MDHRLAKQYSVIMNVSSEATSFGECIQNKNTREANRKQTGYGKPNKTQRKTNGREWEATGGNGRPREATKGNGRQRE